MYIVGDVMCVQLVLFYLVLCQIKACWYVKPWINLMFQCLNTYLCDGKYGDVINFLRHKLSTRP